MCMQMEATRTVAKRLVAEGRLDILQKGQVVDPASFRGPIRLRLRQQQDTAERHQLPGAQALHAAAVAAVGKQAHQKEEEEPEKQ